MINDFKLFEMIQKLLSGLSLLTLAIPIALIVLSGIGISFGSCTPLAIWIIVFASVAIFSLLVDIVLRNITYDDRRYWIPHVFYIIVNLFFLAWDAYGIYLLTQNRKCNTYGWSAYNYIMTAILVAVDLLGSFIFLCGIGRSLFIGNQYSKPQQVYT